MWTPEERRFFRNKLNTPYKIQEYVDALVYNPEDDALSPRYVLLSGDGHCFEAGLLAAAALEQLGHPPLMVDLVAHEDDHHVITIYKTRTGWGSIAKSNTTLLRGRWPIYKSVRELVASYFEFYFNVKGRPALYCYSAPINLNRYNDWSWRTTDENLVEMGMNFCDERHHELLPLKDLKRLPTVNPKLKEACFLGADPKGLYHA